METLRDYRSECCPVAIPLPLWRGVFSACFWAQSQRLLSQSGEANLPVDIVADLSRSVSVS